MKPADAILELLKNRNELRPVQIADLIDMDIDVVENTLVMLSKENRVVAKPVTAPNKTLSTAYSLPATALNWIAPLVPAPAAPAESNQPSLAEKLTKPQRALAYLKNHGRVHAKDLCNAMGVEHPKYSPVQYLGRQIVCGEIAKDGQWYQLGPHADAVSILTRTPKKFTDAKEVVSEIKPDDPDKAQATQVIEMSDLEKVLETRLSAEEYVGYIKASVVELTLRGEATAAHAFTARLVAVTA